MAPKLGARRNGKFRAVSTAPSFNKTPMGSGTPPVPYAVYQDLSTSVGTAHTVRFNSDQAYVLNQSSQSTCIGDAPGVALGVKSGTVSGEVKPVQGSSTVNVCGNPIIRELDPCTMQGANCPGVYVTQPAPAGSFREGSFVVVANPPALVETPAEEDWFQRTWDEIKSLDREYKLVARGLGLVNVVGGVGEIAIGAIGMAAPTGITQIAGAVVTTHGVDTASAGARQLVSGEFEETSTAQTFGPIVDTALGMVGPAGLAKALVRESVQTIAKKEVRELAEKEAKEIAEREAKELAEKEARDLAETEAKDAARQEAMHIAEKESTQVGNAQPRGTAASSDGVRVVVDAVAAPGNEPKRIYSARELIRRAEDPGPFHNFPELLNGQIFRGNRQVIKPDYILYTKRGSINMRRAFLDEPVLLQDGIPGTFEIGVRPSASGRTEVIVHRFFRKDP